MSKQNKVRSFFNIVPFSGMILGLLLMMFLQTAGVLIFLISAIFAIVGAIYEWHCNNKPLEIKIKYFNNGLEKINKIKQGDWIDLRSAENVTLKAGEFKLISLGIAMELPEGYEAHVVPRSSTFKNFGTIETNSMGVIDESYKGNNDCWFFPAYALRDAEIKLNDRICQFRIMKKMPEIKFKEVETLDNDDRGGHGSTGTK